MYENILFSLKEYVSTKGRGRGRGTQDRQKSYLLSLFFIRVHYTSYIVFFISSYILVILFSCVRNFFLFIIFIFDPENIFSSTYFSIVLVLFHQVPLPGFYLSTLPSEYSPFPFSSNLLSYSSKHLQFHHIPSLFTQFKNVDM